MRLSHPIAFKKGLMNGLKNAYLSLQPLDAAKVGKQCGKHRCCALPFCAYPRCPPRCLPTLHPSALCVNYYAMARADDCSRYPALFRVAPPMQNVDFQVSF